MNTMMMLGQLLGGATRVWLEFAFVVSIFTILAFRPERIRNVSLFQAACGFLALSMILPSLLIFAVDESAGASAFGGSRTGQSKDIGMIVKLITASGPVLFAVAFLCGTFAVMPDPATKKTPANADDPDE